jgi:FkbM family methyltransferase
MTIREAIKRIPFVKSAGRAWNEYRWLRRARRDQTYAQNGEDRALLELFSPGYRGTYVDLGANHPYRISNTYLLYTHGWHGVCVDALPMFGPLYRRHRPRDTFLNVGVGTQPGEFHFYEMSFSELSSFSRDIADELVAKGRATVKAEHRIQTRSVAEIVASLAADGQFDVLSIDIEGLDAEIVRNTDWGFVKPRVVICETSSYEHDWAGEIVELFGRQGYTHQCHVGCNDIFVSSAMGRP